MALNVPDEEQHLPPCVRSLPGRSGVKMTLFKSWGAHVGPVRYWSAYPGCRELLAAGGRHGFEDQI